jgi:protein JSN1
MQAEGPVGGVGNGPARYRPPALRALASGEVPTMENSSGMLPNEGGPLPPSTYGPGFRRARAGTLPSNVQLAAQRFAAVTGSNTGGLGSMPGSTESFSEQLAAQRQQQAVNMPALGGAPVRPGLRHAASVASSAATSALTERNSRLRSGSLTALPGQNAPNPFGGSSIFASTWLSSQNGGGGGYGGLDDIRSLGSMDSGADDFDVHTLDYLGLADNPRAATVSELRAQAQAAITGNIVTPSARTRASTVSNPYRQRGPGSLLPTPAPEDDEEMYNEYGGGSYGRQRVDSQPLNAGSYFPSQNVSKAFKQDNHLSPGLSSRPRAISVGILDDPTRTLQRRASAADRLNQAYMQMNDYNDYNDYADYNQQPTYQPAPAVGTPGGILKTDKMQSGRVGGVPSVHFPNGDPAIERASPYLAAPAPPQGRLSPKTEGSTQMQTPTRSLWIGNLDSSVTSEQLIHVFAPYGAIESLRLLPEKVCNTSPPFRGVTNLSYRSVASSTSSTSPTRSGQRTTFSIALAVVLACPMVKLCVSALGRRIARRWLLRRVQPSRVRTLAPQRLAWANLRAATKVSVASNRSFNRRLRALSGLVPFHQLPHLRPFSVCSAPSDRLNQLACLHTRTAASVSLHIALFAAAMMTEPPSQLRASG